MKSKFIFLIILSIILIKSCGIPSPDSIRLLNTPVILVGTKQAIDGTYFRYSYVQKNPTSNPPSIRIRIQAYQPEPDFTGFNIYINNSIDLESGFDDGTKASIQSAHLNHYYFDSTRGIYPNQQRIEARFIIPSQSPTSGLYPSITISELSSIFTLPPPISVYPNICNYPVEFEIDIRWDGKGNNLIPDGRIYNIAISSVDIASKIESKLSNIIKVRFTSNPADGDPDYDL